MPHDIKVSSPEIDDSLWMPDILSPTSEYALDPERQRTSNYPAYFYYYDVAQNDLGHVPYHWHDDLEFFVVHEGRVDATIGGRTIRLEQGDGIFLNKGVPHTYYPPDIIVKDVNIGFCFDPSFIAGEGSYINEKYVMPFAGNSRYPFIVLPGTIPWCSDVVSIIEEYYNNLRTGNISMPALQLRNSITDAWIHLLNHRVDIPETGFDSIKMSSSELRAKTMCGYIAEHYRDSILIEDLARCASISRSEVIRCFERNLATTPGRYILEYRLGQAQSMLRNTEKLIVDIAIECGFNSASYFSKMFKQVLSKSPKEYRAESRAAS